MIKEIQDMSNNIKEFINKNPVLVASYLSELLDNKQTLILFDNLKINKRIIKISFDVFIIFK